MREHLRPLNLIAVWLLIALVGLPDRARAADDTNVFSECERLVEAINRGDQHVSIEALASNKEKVLNDKCPIKGSSSGVAKGDFNNDGYADLAIGVPGETIAGQYAAGAVIILYGSANGLISNANLFYEGRVPGTTAAAYDRFGNAVASGDFNGDGYSDLAIGVPGQSNDGGFEAGAVVILYGSPTGLVVTDSQVFTPAYLIPLPCCFNTYEYSHMGASLAWGDFDGDQRGDLAIGVPGYGYDAQLSNTGGVWVLYGSSPGGLDTARNQWLTSDQWPYSGGQSPSQFGAVLAAGDFNGDHRSDLAIGIPNTDINGFLGATISSQLGSVAVIYGSASGLNTSNTQLWTSDAPGINSTQNNGDRFGAALAAGDFDGDGKLDLAIGAPGKAVGSVAGAGIVFILHGDQTSLVATPQQWNQNVIGRGAQSGAGFGTSLAAGDFNGDGRADLAVGIPNEDVVVSGTTYANAGEVDVIFGSSTGLSTSGHVAQILHDLSGFRTGVRFGFALTAWNFGRNEIITLPTGGRIVLTAADLAVGIPNEPVNGHGNAGAVDVFYGSFLSNGFTSTNNAIFNADTVTLSGAPLGSQTNADFGGALY